MRVVAYDEKGNTFAKKVTIKEDPSKQEPDELGYYGDIIDFGWPCEYYVNSLKRKKYYPFQKDLCIDMGGSNHKGSPVYISKEDMNYIFNNLDTIPRG